MIMALLTNASVAQICLMKSDCYNMKQSKLLIKTPVGYFSQKFQIVTDYPYQVSTKLFCSTLI